MALLRAHPAVPGIDIAAVIPQVDNQTIGCWEAMAGYHHCAALPRQVGTVRTRAITLASRT